MRMGQDFTLTSAAPILGKQPYKRLIVDANSAGKTPDECRVLCRHRLCGAPLEYPLMSC